MSHAKAVRRARPGAWGGTNHNLLSRASNACSLYKLCTHLWFLAEG